MKRITEFKNYKIDRDKYVFRERKVSLKDEEGVIRTYGCIVLENRINNEVVAYTGLERYVVDLSRGVFNESGFRIAVSRVIAFLNYILHKTEINNICEVDANTIKNYLVERKIKPNGEEMKSDSWNRIRYDILRFLQNYYRFNNQTVEFGYNIDDIIATKIVTEKRQRGTRNHVINEYRMLNVKPPKKMDNKKRNRVLMYGHLKPLLYAAKKYEPMVYLAIMLMAYAGIREGEVVNITFGDIYIQKKIGVTNKIIISLNESDRFRTGKSHKGVIKKYREQEIYSNENFLEEVEQAIEYHKDYLESLGLPTEGCNPLFYNKQKNPMSMTTLTSRIRNLFYNHFIRILKETSIYTAFEGETYAYISKYEEQYPGAHMFRHWFTMYLITKERLRPEMVRKWRGDSPDSNSYEEYLHINQDLIEEYKNTAYSFQENLLGEIYE